MTGTVLFGCKSTSRYLYASLRDVHPIATIVTISPELARAQKVADYDDLRDLSGEVEVVQARRYGLDCEEDRMLFARGFDLGLAIGWQRLIPAAVLETFGAGVFGMHGSSQNLPFGRGRSPMNWSILEGREWFHTNLFRYLPGADDGPIAASACFTIQPGDTAETLHFKNLLAMASLVKNNLEAIRSGRLVLRTQPPGEPTYYPKREPGDGLIDWGADVFAIERLVRAVAPPFDGASCFRRGDRITILRAALFYADIEAHPFRDASPGQVCAVFPNGKFCVRCVGGVLLVHEYRMECDSDVVAGEMLDSGGYEVRHFPRNRFGNFDLPQEGCG